MAPCFKLLFLQYFLFTTYEAAGKECNEQALRALYPCGDSAKFKELNKNAANNMDYDLVGEYCYADSRKKVKQHITYLDADKRCQEDGARLAIFPEQSAWDNLVKANKLSSIFETSDEYWIGANFFGKTLRWTRPSLKVETWGTAKLPWASGEPRDKKKFPCVKMKNNIWYTTRCLALHHFLCQKEGKSAYNTEVSFAARNDDKINRRKYIRGDNATIICEARSEKGLQINIYANKYGSHTINMTSGQTGIEKIFGTNIVRKDYYVYEKLRCFRRQELSVKITMSLRMQDKLLVCSHVDKELVKLNRKMYLRIIQQSQTPAVKVNGVKKRTGSKIRPAFRDPISYFCHAKLGSSKVMTFAITQGNDVWAMPIHTNGTRESLGTLPPAFGQIQVQTFPGVHPYDGSQYINITIKFDFGREMIGASFACYSYSVKEDFMQNFSISKNDGLSVWVDFGVLSKRQAAKLKILKLTTEEIEGRETINQCETFSVTCTGLGAKRDSVTFKIILTKETAQWKFGTPPNLTNFATIKEARELVDPVYGASLQIVISFSVQPRMTNATLECETIDKITLQKKKDTIKLNLQPKVTELPPKLTSKLHSKKDPDLFVTLRCESLVGRRATQSWKVIDDTGTLNIVLVPANGDISGIKFSWLEVKLLNATKDRLCGQTIISEVNMLKLSPKEFGVTFYCYSYNVKKDQEIDKKTKEKLTAFYEFNTGGGVIKEKDPELEGYIIWYLTEVFVFLAISAVLWYLAMNLKKTAQQLTETPDNDEEDGAEINHSADDNIDKASDFGNRSRMSQHKPKSEASQIRSTIRSVGNRSRMSQHKPKSEASQIGSTTRSVTTSSGSFYSQPSKTFTKITTITSTSLK